MTFCWRWELTPEELFSGFQLARATLAESVRIETKPFSCADRSLAGTGFSYQLAVSDRSVTFDMQELRRMQPELPTSGDRRSGVLVFDGPTLIGCCVIPGQQTLQGYRMVVLPAYREKKLAYRMLLEWCRATKRARTLPKQELTILSAKALLSVHTELVKWAIDTGHDVPERVQEAVAKKRSVEEILSLRS